MCIAPGTEDISTGNPLWRNTSTMRRLSGCTSASNTEMPNSAATSARWASRIVPTPFPLSSLEIAKATSARPGPEVT